MSDPILNQVAQQAANAANTASSEQATPKQPIEIDIRDQNRFEEAMHDPNQAEQGQNAAKDAECPLDEHGECSLGDAILNGLEKMKSSHDVRTDRIEEQLTNSEGKDLSVQDCVRLQFEVMQMSMEQELTGKIADKTSQGVQTLFKNQ